MNKNKTLFIVDDDNIYLKAIEKEIKSSGNYNVLTFSSVEECLEKIGLNPDIVILDYYLNSTNAKAINGLSVLDKIKEHKPKTHVIMLSGQDRIEVVVSCMKHNASDYIVKSETAFVRLKRSISAILNNIKLEKENYLYKRIWLFSISTVTLVTTISIFFYFI